MGLIGTKQKEQRNIGLKHSINSAQHMNTNIKTNTNTNDFGLLAV